jgi:hypothetical protein
MVGTAAITRGMIVIRTVTITRGIIVIRTTVKKESTAGIEITRTKRRGMIVKKDRIKDEHFSDRCGRFYWVPSF